MEDTTGKYNGRIYADWSEETFEAAEGETGTVMTSVFHGLDGIPCYMERMIHEEDGTDYHSINAGDQVSEIHQSVLITDEGEEIKLTACIYVDLSAEWEEEELICYMNEGNCSEATIPRGFCKTKSRVLQAKIPSPKVIFMDFCRS